MIRKLGLADFRMQGMKPLSPETILVETAGRHPFLLVVK
jgi:hypothetical protein